jgi:hypothetical protein
MMPQVPDHVYSKDTLSLIGRIYCDAPQSARLSLHEIIFLVSLCDEIDRPPQSGPGGVLIQHRLFD